VELTNGGKMEAFISSYPLISLFIVMFVAGILGGAINHFLTSENNENNKTVNMVTPSKLFIGRDLLLGLGASFTVPLFLNMISSNLISAIYGSSTKPSEPDKIYVFAGFCLIAAISSRAFIRTLSDRILKVAQEAKKEVKAAEGKIEEIRASVAPIIDKETEAETETVTESSVDTSLEVQENVKKVLRSLAFGRHTIRSLSGISSETGLSKEEVHQILDDLILKGLVAQKDGDKGPRWYISIDGRRFARASNNGVDTDASNPAAQVTP
jgi:hypothetical protein